LEAVMAKAEEGNLSAFRALQQHANTMIRLCGIPDPEPEVLARQRQGIERSAAEMEQEDAAAALQADAEQALAAAAVQGVATAAGQPPALVEEVPAGPPSVTPAAPLNPNRDKTWTNRGQTGQPVEQPEVAQKSLLSTNVLGGIPIELPPGWRPRPHPGPCPCSITAHDPQEQARQRAVIQQWRSQFDGWMQDLNTLSLVDKRAELRRKLAHAGHASEQNRQDWRQQSIEVECELAKKIALLAATAAQQPQPAERLVPLARPGPLMTRGAAPLAAASPGVRAPTLTADY
jgi:hypothetical protein